MTEYAEFLLLSSELIAEKMTEADPDGLKRAWLIAQFKDEDPGSTAVQLTPYLQ